MNGTITKRKNYLIKKTFQMKVIAQFLFLVIIGGILSGALMYVVASSELKTDLLDAHMTVKNTWEILLPTVLLTQTISIVLISLATVYVILFLSHKIAGPLYKFEKVAEEFGNGNFSVNTNLRKNDELISLQYAFQNMGDSLKGKITNFKNSFDEFQNIVTDLKDEIKNSNSSDAKKQSLETALDEFNKKYENNLNDFTL